MMRYEELKIELIALDASDFIATSSEVTTGNIAFPWQDGNTVNFETFNLMASVKASAYETD